MSNISIMYQVLIIIHFMIKPYVIKLIIFNGCNKLILLSVVLSYIKIL